MGRHRRHDSVVERDENELCVLKSQAIALPNRKVMFIVMSSKKGVEGEGFGFYKTYMRVGPVESWLELAESVHLSGPLERLSTENLGIDEDFIFYWNKSRTTRMDFGRILRNRFKKAMLLRDFVVKVELDSQEDQKLKYPLTFEGLNISDYESFEDGRWYVDTRDTGRTVIRKRPRVIH